MHSVDDRRTMRVGRASAIEGAGDRFAAMARLAVPLRVPVGGFGAVDVDRLASEVEPFAHGLATTSFRTSQIKSPSK